MNSNLKFSIITPYRSYFDLRIKELWDYRDLFKLMVKRDIKVSYKQTILGPLWFFIQPILTTGMFLLIFTRIARISTDGVPPVLFYLAGITLWNYFSECLRLTSDTFVKNAGLFGKVYFPRIISPLSIVTSNLVKFLIQLTLFLFVYIFYLRQPTTDLSPNLSLILLPIYILILGLTALGFGLMISALTTKYRDLTFLIQFGIQLWMYATPVIYPVTRIPDQFKWIIMLNPVSSIVESFRYGFTGKGEFLHFGLIYSLLFSCLILTLGTMVFTKTEKSFMDTV